MAITPPRAAKLKEAQPHHAGNAVGRHDRTLDVEKVAEDLDGGHHADEHLAQVRKDG